MSEYSEQIPRLREEEERIVAKIEQTEVELHEIARGNWWNDPTCLDNEITPRHHKSQGLGLDLIEIQNRIFCFLYAHMRLQAN